MDYRIGIGYDIHRLVEGRKLFMGGVEIPYIKGLLGHSDADVVLHALCDALLGAMAEGDIGEHFPDSNPKYHNMPSIEFLKIVFDLMKRREFQISNMDIAVIAEEPKILPFKKQMQEKIAAILKIKENCVSIKGKTNEGVGALGNKEAIACYAVVILFKGGQKW